MAYTYFVSQFSLLQLTGNVARFSQVVSLLAKYGLADWLTTVHPEIAKFVLRQRPELSEGSRESRIRTVLTELGTTYIKLGQILSTRADLVGPALAQELTKLQSQTPADAPEVVRATILAELGKPVDEVFASFDERALASASIGQVHMARHADGRRLVVKVQHAGIEPAIRHDLDNLAVLAKLAEQHPELKRYNPVPLVQEFRQGLLRELDFAREARHLQMFRANFASDSTVYFPEPFPDLSGKRVLTMEFLSGVSLRDADRLAERGVDVQALAQRGANIFLEMIFRDGFYHADPHPGNLLLLTDGRVGVLDCGMIGRVDDRLRRSVEQLLLAVTQRDADLLTRVIMRLTSAPAGVDQALLGSDTADFIAFYGSQPLDRLELGAALTEMTDIIRRHQLVMPGRVSLLIKVLVMLEGTSRLLNPSFNLRELLVPYQRKILRRRLSPKRYFKRLQQLFSEWEHLVDTLPREVGHFIEQVREGKLDLHVQHRGLRPSVNRLVMGLLTSALFLGSVELWSRGVPPLLAGTSVFGVLGSTASVVMGLRLVLAIARSGRLDSPD